MTLIAMFLQYYPFLCANLCFSSLQPNDFDTIFETFRYAGFEH